MEKIRLLLAEDENIIRISLTLLFDSYPNYFVVGQAQDGIELIEKYIDLKPDIVLCDITMPIMNGFEASAKILSQYRSAKIILFTAHDEHEYLCSAIKIGVAGFISKFFTDKELKIAIQSVYEGRNYYLGKTNVEIEAIKLKCCDKEMDSKLEELTRREKEILTMVARGLTSQEVANKLFLSKKTVDNHRLAIKEKLGVSKRSELVELQKKLLISYH